MVPLPNKLKKAFCSCPLSPHHKRCLAHIPHSVLDPFLLGIALANEAPLQSSSKSNIVWVYLTWVIFAPNPTTPTSVSSPRTTCTKRLENAAPIQVSFNVFGRCEVQQIPRLLQFTEPFHSRLLPLKKYFLTTETSFPAKSRFSVAHAWTIPESAERIWWPKKISFDVCR